MEVDDVVDGGVAARLRCKEVEGRGVDGAREDCGSNAVAVFAMAVFDDEEDTKFDRPLVSAPRRKVAAGRPLHDLQGPGPTKFYEI